MVYGSVLKCISNLQTNPTHLAMCCVGPADTSVSRQGRLFVVMRGGSSSARVLCKTIVPGAKRCSQFNKGFIGMKKRHTYLSALVLFFI